MAGNFKVRRNALLMSGLQAGSAGTQASKIMFGLAEIGVPAITASGGFSASDFTLTDAAIGDNVFLMPYGVNSAQAAVVIRAASVTAAACVSASFASATGSAVEAHQASLMYFLIG